MKIKVLSKKVTTTNEKGKENTFYRYFTPVKIHVIDTNGNDIGEKEMTLSVHFTKDAFKKLNDEKVFSMFECNGTDVGFPIVYLVPKDKTSEEENAKNYVWIRDFIKESPIPYEPKDNTCVFLTDEEESDGVEITE